MTTLEVEDGETILEAALDNGLELSHDCKMGVCMTCPAKLVGCWLMILVEAQLLWRPGCSAELPASTC